MLRMRPGCAVDFEGPKLLPLGRVLRREFSGRRLKEGQANELELELPPLSGNFLASSAG
jgi:hypothetical protein